MKFTDFSIASILQPDRPGSEGAMTNAPIFDWPALLAPLGTLLSAPLVAPVQILVPPTQKPVVVLDPKMVALQERADKITAILDQILEFEVVCKDTPPKNPLLSSVTARDYSRKLNCLTRLKTHSMNSNQLVSEDPIKFKGNNDPVSEAVYKALEFFLGSVSMADCMEHSRKDEEKLLRTIKNMRGIEDCFIRYVIRGENFEELFDAYFNQ